MCSKEGKAGLKELINTTANIHTFTVQHIGTCSKWQKAIFVRTTDPGCQTDGFPVQHMRAFVLCENSAPSSVLQKCHAQQYFFYSVTFKPNFAVSADSRLISTSQSFALLSGGKRWRVGLDWFRLPQRAIRRSTAWLLLLKHHLSSGENDTAVGQYPPIFNLQSIHLPDWTFIC